MNTSYDISGKVDPLVVEAIMEIQAVASSISIQFFIIGAAARDIIIEHCYGITSLRRTLDVDLGIEIPNWEKMDDFSAKLLRTGTFKKGSQKQRFSYKAIEIDIVPFGPIAGARHMIAWPPEFDVNMSTLGLEDAFQSSLNVRISKAPILDIKVPSIPGLVVMKLISWDEKYPVRKKDAEDLLFMMKNYESGSRDRLFESELELLLEEKMDAKMASVRLLGRDMAHICKPDTLARISQILEEGMSSNGNYSLISDMTGIGGDFDNVLTMIERLKSGISEYAHKRSR